MLRRLWARDVEQRLRGGWRQREAQNESAAEHVQMSRLAAGHLLAWADGDLSAARVVSHMRDAVEDGMSHPTVVRLAGCQTGQHAQKSLVDLLESKVGLKALLTTVEDPHLVSRQYSIIEQLNLTSPRNTHIHTRTHAHTGTHTYTYTHRSTHTQGDWRGFVASFLAEGACRDCEASFLGGVALWSFVGCISGRCCLA